MSTFDQFANQGGAAAGDDAEAAAAQSAADDLLRRSADAAGAADFGGGPLGAHPEPGENTSESAGQDRSDGDLPERDPFEDNIN